MVRSAAKNHGFVTILTDPADYPALLEELDAGDGATSCPADAAALWALLDRFLAASVFWLKGSSAPDNPLVARTREALKA